MAPIYVELSPTECRPPMDLALGDVLMVLGLIRNQGLPVRLRLRPGIARELVEAHPLVRDLVEEPGSEEGRLKLHEVRVERSGRSVAWSSDTTHEIPFAVTPVERVRANPVLAHSLHYGLANTDDRPGAFVDLAAKPPTAGLLSFTRPTLVIYPLNPGRGDFFWQDEAWWLSLIGQVRDKYAVVAVGAHEYGEIGRAVDAALAWDDPVSSLNGLAWLLAKAEGFVGRDGGVSHLAAAVNPNVTMIWDSMASYRYWACGQIRHILFSNPYAFRYPQTARFTMAQAKAMVKKVQVGDGQGGSREVELPEEGYEDKVREIFGGLDAFLAEITARAEVDEEAACVAGWMNQPTLKDKFYAASLAFALNAIKGSSLPGSAWVAPIFP